MNQVRKRRRARVRRRVGVSLIIVLGILTITLAMSYAIVRVQATSLQIQSNGQRTLDARQSALAGVSEGLRRMRLRTWPGVDAAFTVQFGNNTWSEVRYTTGDRSLLPTDPDYAEFPYRVTVASTGYAADPTDPNHRAVYQVEAVAQLIRRAMYAPPPAWASSQNYTLLQWSNAAVQAELPLQVEGPAYLGGPLQLSQSYPSDSRPFDGVIDEVAVYNTALRAADISFIFFGFRSYSTSSFQPISWWRFSDPAGSSVLTDLLGLHHGNYRGALPGVNGGPRAGHGYGASFDGYDDFVDLNAIDISGNALTILAWFKADDFDSPESTIIAKANGYSQENDWWMLGAKRKNGKNRLCFRIKTVDGSTKTLVAKAGDLAPGQWTFAAAVYDGEKMQLYKNGILVDAAEKKGGVAGDSQVGVRLGDAYPGSPRTKYLADLNAMRNRGLDQRPFTGPVALPHLADSHATTDFLQVALGVAVHENSPQTTGVSVHPGDIATYQLYPGGKIYDVPKLPASIAHTTWGPDVLTNPLGVFRRASNLKLGDNARIRGTLILSSKHGDVLVKGTGVVLEGVPLPNLDGDSTPSQLPTAIVRDDLVIKNYSQGVLRGQAVVFDGFRFEADQGTAFHLEGKLFTSDFLMKPNRDWAAVKSSQWNQLLINYNNAYGSVSNPAVLFPEWVESQTGLETLPRLTIKPETRNIRYHWQDWTQPVFVAHQNDDGLVWDLVDWKEAP